MENKKSYIWLAILLTVIVSLVVTAAIVLINHRNERGNENINGEVMKEEGETDKTVPKEEIKQVNVMAADTVEIKEPDGVEHDDMWTDSDFYGTGIIREEVKSVTFLDSLDESEGEDTKDISASGDGSVLLWYKESSDEGYFDFYIAADGKVRAGADTCKNLFFYCTRLERINFNGCFDTSRAETMEGMFANCCWLESIDVSEFDTSNVTDMSYMFYMEDGEAILSSLDVSGFDTSSVTNMNNMFDGCGYVKELDVSDFDTSSVTDMGNMFFACWSLESLDVSGFDTSKVTNMYGMFGGCSSVKCLDVAGFDTSGVTNMAEMFFGCCSVTGFDLSSFDTSNVTDMNYMFADCIGLESLDLSGFDTSGVEDMRCMFRECSRLESIDLSVFDTSKVLYMSDMLYGVNGEIILPDPFDTSSCVEYHGFMSTDESEWIHYFEN